MVQAPWKLSVLHSIFVTVGVACFSPQILHKDKHLNVVEHTAFILKITIAGFSCVHKKNNIKNAFD